MSRIFRFFAIIFLVCAEISSANAQSGKTILVLDASGSMWGQIDGEAKIAIAKRAIGDLLDSLPAETELGLTVYGHRQKGQCSDIETIVLPGQDNRADIRAAVETISPKGKTPLSDAVLQAAETLKYEEEVATVILLSDGIETCDRDPCAVGRALEQAGVGFTAHVIGFDIKADADRKQLACLAEETGGRFLTASNATELTTALEEMVEAPAAPPPPPVALDSEFVATLGDGGPVITDGLLWTLAPAETDGTRLDNFEIAQLRMAIRPGVYDATVQRPKTEDQASVTVRIAPDSENRFVLVLPDPTPKATLEAPTEAPLGSKILVSWTGPEGLNDRIQISNIDDRDSVAITYAYVNKGNPAQIQMPPLPGTYEVRYFNQSSGVLARAEITATAVEFSLDAPESAVASTNIDVTWGGPDYQADRIVVAKLGTTGSKSINYAYTKHGSPSTLAMPVEPGDYELRYVMSLGNTIQATRPITVTDLVATITAPANGAAGSSIVITWDGPDNKNDRITIATVGERGSKSESYKYTKEGSPVKMILPGVPGEYEIRYVISQDNKVAASSLIQVGPPEASISAPSSATIGGTAVVEWTGPDNRNDHISIALPDARPSKSESYTYTKQGSPLQLTMPAKPGTYELRYILSQGNVILATAPLVVEESIATLSAPQSGEAGGQVVVEWTGPDTKNDYIAIYKADSDDNKHETYTYTKQGSPLRVALPAEPGEYEIRYILNKDRTTLARRAITVAAAEASISAPSSGESGSVIVVEWTGPNNKNDFIALSEAGQGDTKSVSYKYTREGSPLQMPLPGKAGDYELRYVLSQGQSVIVRVPFKVTESAASISAPSTVVAGAPVMVEWQGPNSNNDYISIAKADAKGNKYETYTYTKKGAPLQVTAPGKPGTYEVRYVLNKGSVVLASTTIEVTAVDAGFDTVDSATAGSNMVVSWYGPDYTNDYIALSELGTPDSKRVTYSYTKEGSPLIIKIPEKPGQYELRYILNSDGTVLARVPLTIE